MPGDKQDQRTKAESRSEGRPKKNRKKDAEKAADTPSDECEENQASTKLANSESTSEGNPTDRNSKTKRKKDSKKASEILVDECEDNDDDLIQTIKSAFEDLLTEKAFVNKFVSIIRDQLILEIHESLCDEVKRSLDFDIESRDARITALEEEMECLKAERKKEMMCTRESLDDMEQYSRRNCLIFSGVIENSGENTTQVIKDLCSESLNVEVNAEDIDRIHRLGQARPVVEPPKTSDPDRNQAASSTSAKVSDPKPPTLNTSLKARNIIVKFTNYNARERVYSVRKRLKESKDKPRVFINENLTKTRANLLWKIRKATKNTEYRVWTQDGVIVVNKPSGGRIKVTRENDLDKLSELDFS